MKLYLTWLLLWNKRFRLSLKLSDFDLQRSRNDAITHSPLFLMCEGKTNIVNESQQESNLCLLCTNLIINNSWQEDLIVQRWPHFDIFVNIYQFLLHLRPHGLWNIHPRARRTFLSTKFKGRSYCADNYWCNVSWFVDEMKIFPSTFWNKNNQYDWESINGGYFPQIMILEHYRILWKLVLVFTLYLLSILDMRRSCPSSGRLVSIKS